MPAIAPARCIFRRGFVTETGREPPLRKTTSAAYGVSHHSIAIHTAVDCPTQPFPKQNPYLKVCRRESLCTARPDLASWAAIYLTSALAGSLKGDLQGTGGMSRPIQRPPRKPDRSR